MMQRVSGTFAGLATGVALTILTLSASSQTPAQSGLAGVIVDSMDRPVAFAQIAVVNGRLGATADTAGHFRLIGLRDGKTIVEVRRLGYEPVYFSVDVPATSVVEVKIRMRALPRELMTVNVDEIHAQLRKVGFYERMAAGNGHFVPPESIERMHAGRATDALSSIPNVAVDRRGNKTRVMTSNYRCEYGIVIDNMLVGEAGSRVRTTSPDDIVTASDLYAIEVYPRNRGLPMKFLGLAHEDGCGTIVIWTRSLLSH